VLERLPRRVSAAGSAERAAVREAVLLESHGVAFEQALLAHIRANLPALLLPQHESAIDAALREGVGHLDTLINAAVKGSSKRFEEEKARLETLSVQLDRLREDLGKKLTPLKDILETGELISDEGKSRRVLTRIAKEHGLEDGALIPFLAWNDELGKQLDALLSTIAGHLEKGGPLTFASAGVTERQASRVRRAIEALVDAGYDQAVAARGDKREAAGKSEKAQLHRMNEALNGLADALTPAVTSMIRTLVQREGDRIHQAMQALLAAQLRELEVGTERLSNDLALRLPPPELAKVGQELVWEPELSLGFKVRQVDRIVQVGVREETYLAEKSFWNLYGFLNRRKTREVPVREQRSFDRADIPGAQDLLFSFLEQIQADSPADAVTRWLRESFESFDRQMAEFHRDRVERYRARLLVEQKRARERKDAELAALTKLREDLARVVAGPGA
jgi:hypothetical protein